MRIAIVEDHAAERQLMAVMCAEYFKRTRDIGVECVTFADAESFIKSWKDARYDLLLLDCYLSDAKTPRMRRPDLISHGRCADRTTIARSCSSRQALISPCSATRCRQADIC